MQIFWNFYCNTTGYSLASQEYLLAMMHVKPDVDIKLNYINVKATSGVSQKRVSIFDALKKKSLTTPRVSLYHSIPTLYKKTEGSEKNIGFCIYETIDPPQEWVRSMNNMDAIVTASHFNKNVFESSGVKVPIHVIGHCFDREMFNAHIQPQGRYRPMTFLSIGTWKKRKNWELLIRAWYDAFYNSDNVCLLLKTDKSKELKNTILNIKRNGQWRSKKTAPIYLEETPHLDFEDIPSLMKKADVCINPAMGEGFSLVVQHAMALGIPVVATRFGGTLEYAKAEFCTYLEPKEYKRYSALDGIPQFVNKIWPVIRMTELRDKMLYVRKNYKECLKKAAHAYKYVHANYNYDVIGRKFLEVLLS